MQFYYIYKSLAHWGFANYVGPVNLHERLMHIQEGKRTLGTEIDWLSDTMSNDLKHLIGDASNSEFILDPEGRIVRMRLWSDPGVLREDLAELVGLVENPTEIEDLDLKVESFERDVPTGVIERVKLDGNFHPLKAEPQVTRTGVPFYVKLRVAAENNLLSHGQGKLYLGFFLDPIYDVHWNNLKAPVEFEISVTGGVSFSPGNGIGPVIDEPSDGDPREFVLDVTRGLSVEPVPVTFRYYACTDKWCVPVTQNYLISWELDRDSGVQFGNGEVDPRMLEQYPE